MADADLHPQIDSVYNRLRRTGWQELKRGHTCRYFRKRDWLAEVPDRIRLDVRFRRIGRHLQDKEQTA